MSILQNDKGNQTVVSFLKQKQMGTFVAYLMVFIINVEVKCNCSSYLFNTVLNLELLFSVICNSCLTKPSAGRCIRMHRKAVIE